MKHNESITEAKCDKSRANIQRGERRMVLNVVVVDVFVVIYVVVAVYVVVVECCFLEKFFRMGKSDLLGHKNYQTAENSQQRKANCLTGQTA